MKVITYTSTLSQETMSQLESYSLKFKVPKNRIIDEALRAYFDKLKKAEYTYSFKKASTDQEMQTLAEEGFEDYLKILGEQ